MSKFNDIFEAAKEGTVEDLRYFIEEKGVDVNSKRDLPPELKGFTPLHMVAANGVIRPLDIWQYLIDKGADVKAKNKSGFTPLHFAAMCGLFPVFELLISHGSDVNAKTDDGSTVLHMACSSPRSDDELTVKTLQTLISLGADINAENEGGKTSLHFAARSNKGQGVIKYLLSEGANVNARDAAGMTPLHDATIENPSEETISCLISNGADVNAKTTDAGFTPLDFAILNKDVVAERVIRAAGGHRKDSSGSGSGGCLVFFAALGTLLTSGICALAFAITGFLR